MRAVITITESASMPGRFQYSLQQGRTLLKSRDAGHDPAAAAAKAVELSIAYGGKSGYVILGPQQVLDRIPLWLRAKEPNHA